jgi:tetratricopeptide (TPR) repeat protein
MKIDSKVSLQQQNRVSSLSERAQDVCARAKTLEEAGEFEDARATMSEFWQRIGERPRLDGLDERARAEVLLRTGTLSGWIGSSRQIAGAQEIAKDLISEAARIFERAGDNERVAGTRIDLAICYWREGAVDEARVNLEEAALQLGDIDSEQRLRLTLSKAIVEQVSNRSGEALRLFRESAHIFEGSSNHVLRGKFHNEYASLLQVLGLPGKREDFIDQALVEYAAASFHAEQAGNKRFLASIENNVGYLFVQLERFRDAQKHLDRARSLFTGLKDEGMVAQVDDTRARALLGEGQFAQAETVAAAAVKILRRGDERSILAAALTTHATAVAKVGRHSEALGFLNEAVRLAQEAGEPETGALASLTIIEELAAVLSPTELQQHYDNAASALAQSQHAATRSRLGDCARAVLAAQGRAATSAAEEPTADQASIVGSLEEQVLRYEGELIRRALQASDGSITRAARLLGVTHQGLAFILNGRQKKLLSSRKPAKPRRRSIIRYH